MSNKYKFPILGFSGNARSGKDSLFSALTNILDPHGISTFRGALADELKIMVDPFLRKEFGISAFTTDKGEKELIRGILVEVGRIKREQSRGTFWTGLLKPKIESHLNDGELCCITDIRYDDLRFPNDEFNWLKKSFDGILIYIERLLDDGTIIPPANEQELKFNPILKSKADYILRWPTVADEKIRESIASLQLSSLLNKICPNYQTMN